MGLVLCGCFCSDGSPGGDSGSGSFYLEPHTQPLKKREVEKEPQGDILALYCLVVEGTLHFLLTFCW